MSAAKRLDVTPEKLREALGAAQDSQLDEAVRDGAASARVASCRANAPRALAPSEERRAGARRLRF